MDVNVLVHQIIDLQSNQAHAVVYFCPKGLELRNRHRNQGNPLLKKTGFEEKLCSSALFYTLWWVLLCRRESGRVVYFEMFRKQGECVGSYLTSMRAELHMQPSF